MYIVDTNFKSSDRPRACRYTVEKFVNGQWLEKESVAVMGGSGAARRTFLLETDERLVVSELPNEVEIWDDEQKAVKKVPVDRLVVDPPENSKFSYRRRDRL